MEIIAPTENIRTFYKMALYWGVSPLMVEFRKEAGLDAVFEDITKMIEDKKILPKGSLIVQLGGAPVGVSGSTNVLRINSIGNVATRGVPTVIGKGKVQGRVHIFKNKTTTPEGYILVMNYLMESDLHVLKRAKALILQSDKGEEFARVAGETLNIPVITRAEGSTSALFDNETVLVDGDEGIVYRNPTSSENE
jgi:pyruvate kinase